MTVEIHVYLERPSRGDPGYRGRIQSKDTQGRSNLAVFAGIGKE